jgi:hypothetical protein
MGGSVWVRTGDGASARTRAFLEASCTSGRRSSRPTGGGSRTSRPRLVPRGLCHRLPARLGHGRGDARREHPDLRGEVAGTSMAPRRPRAALPHARRLE